MAKQGWAFVSLMVALSTACRTDPATAPDSSDAVSLARAAGRTIDAVADFSQCGPTGADWFAYRDGDGPWTVLPGAGPVFRFSISSNNGAVAFVRHFGSVHAPEIFFFTRSELLRLMGGGYFGCGAPPSVGKLLHVTLAGVGSQQVVLGRLGRTGDGFAGVGSTTLDLRNVSGDVGDFFGSLREIDQTPTRFFLARNVDIASIPDGGFLPFTTDFAGPGSFDPLVTQATIGGLAGETSITRNLILTDCRQTIFQLGGSFGSGASFSIYGVPPALRLPNERQLLTAVASDGIQFRSDSRVYRPAAIPSLVLPPVQAVPAITELPGPYLRLRFAVRPAFEHGGLFAQYNFSNASGGLQGVLLLAATPGYVSNPNATLSAPDLSGLPRWDNAWAPPVGVDVRWLVETASAASFWTEPDWCQESMYSGKVGGWAHGTVSAAISVGSAAPIEGVARAAFDPRVLVRSEGLSKQR